MTGQQLRNSILQEAIQGRLVPNVLQPGEKTGAELLQNILTERQKKENDEKGKKAKKFSLSIIEEEPWELPEGWCWCKLSELFNIVSARRVHQSDWRTSGVPFYRTREIGWLAENRTDVKPELYIDESLYEKFKESGYPVADDIMMTAVGTVGKTYVVKPEDKFYYKDASVLCLENISKVNPYYICYVIASEFFKSMIAEEAMGTTVATITMVRANEYILPLPPLSIQKAIVEKIEALFPLVDEYDNAAGELKALNEALPDKLRKSVLQEAIHGNLVPNDIPEGESTASELLQQILKERQDRENKEKGKKAKKLTLSEIEEDVVDLPNGWSWCKLSDLGDCLYGVSESAKTVGDYKLLRITDIQNDNVNWDTVPMSDYKNKDVDNYLLKPGDLVFARTGGTVGKSYLIEEAPNNAIYASYLIRVRFQGGALLPKYIKYFFQSPQYWSQIIESSEGTGQPNCNGTKLANLNIPLPPLSIQKAIVAKIEEVFSAIDKLKY